MIMKMWRVYFVMLQLKIQRQEKKLCENRFIKANIDVGEKLLILYTLWCFRY